MEPSFNSLHYRERAVIVCKLCLRPHLSTPVSVSVAQATILACIKAIVVLSSLNEGRWVPEFLTIL